MADVLKKMLKTAYGVSQPRHRRIQYRIPGWLASCTRPAANRQRPDQPDDLAVGSTARASTCSSIPGTTNEQATVERAGYGGVKYWR
jgi:hypothetical protein